VRSLCSEALFLSEERKSFFSLSLMAILREWWICVLFVAEVSVVLYIRTVFLIDDVMF
jgi:hypothetical protein